MAEIRIESTCCDEDFQWVDQKNQSSKHFSPMKSKKAQSQLSEAAIDSNMCLSPSNQTPLMPQMSQGHSNQRNLQWQPPPASLDRRQFHRHSRHERNSKSRSVHSLQESSQSSDNKCSIDGPRGKN